MISPDKKGLRKYAVLGIAIIFASAVLLPLANGDVLTSGSLSLSYKVSPPPCPPITIKEPCTNYQGATIVMSTSYVNGSKVVTLQVHLNFKLNGSKYFTTELLNILEVFNTGHAKGNLTVLIQQSAQAGPGKMLNSTYTDHLKVYMSHTYQTSSNLGTYLANNTLYKFPIYPFSLTHPMYYIGLNYTEPPLPPGTTDINSIQQFVNFTFTVVS